MNMLDFLLTDFAYSFPMPSVAPVTTVRENRLSDCDVK